MFTATIEGWDELERAWNGAVKRVYRDGCRRGVREAVADAVAEAERLAPEHTGALKAGIHGGTTDVEGTGAEGHVTSDAPYSSFVEEGTRPHDITAKRAPMLAWENPQGDWHHAKTVHHPGTRPHPFMGPALQKAERVIEREIGVATARAQAALDR